MQKPGITDLASIVFSDEATILASHTDDPDKAYNELIRPWKSRLGLFYVAKQSLLLDIQIFWLTAVVVLNRPVALRGVATLLERYGADPDLKKVCLRNAPCSQRYHRNSPHCCGATRPARKSADPVILPH